MVQDAVARGIKCALKNILIQADTIKPRDALSSLG